MSNRACTLAAEATESLELRQERGEARIERKRKGGGVRGGAGIKARSDLFARGGERARLVEHGERDRGRRRFRRGGTP